MSDREVSGPIAWNETIWLNVFRAFCAGCVWAILIGTGAITLPPTDITRSPWMLPFMYPLVHFMIIGMILGLFVPIARLFGYEFIFGPCVLFFACVIAAGDPVVFILRLWKQWLAPIQVVTVQGGCQAATGNRVWVTV